MEARGSNKSSTIVGVTTNTKNKLKQDVEALANLLYDIFKERQANANVNHDQNTKSYTTEDR